MWPQPFPLTGRLKTTPPKSIARPPLPFSRTLKTANKIQEKQSERGRNRELETKSKSESKKLRGRKASDPHPYLHARMKEESLHSTPLSFMHCFCVRCLSRAWRPSKSLNRC